MKARGYLLLDNFDTWVERERGENSLLGFYHSFTREDGILAYSAEKEEEIDDFLLSMLRPLAKNNLAYGILGNTELTSGNFRIPQMLSEKKWEAQLLSFNKLIRESWEEYQTLETTRLDLLFQQMVIYLRDNDYSLSVHIPVYIDQPVNYDSFIRAIFKNARIYETDAEDFFYMGMDFDEEGYIEGKHLLTAANRLIRLRDFLRTGDYITSPSIDSFIWRSPEGICEFVDLYSYKDLSFLPPEFFDFVVQSQLFSLEAFEEHYYPDKVQLVEGYSRAIGNKVEIYYFVEEEKEIKTELINGKKIQYSKVVRNLSSMEEQEQESKKEEIEVYFEIFLKKAKKRDNNLSSSWLEELHRKAEERIEERYARKIIQLKPEELVQTSLKFDYIANEYLQRLNLR